MDTNKDMAIVRMEKTVLKFVIVGHVDHGKSTLIGRLLYDTDSLPEGKVEEIKAICDSLGKEFELGYIVDNLEEERGQGITIDTTQIIFKPKKRQYTIIDAPGHVELIKNMITGATQAEAAILIVNAQEGVQEQTRRHTYIINMLGLKQIIVVMNKMDLCNYRRERYKEVKDEIIKFSDKLNIKPTYIIPISAKEGVFVAKKSKHMQWYDGPTVLEALNIFKPYDSNTNKPLRFSVQDVYNQDKRIIVGKVETGRLKSGDEVVILPANEKTTIKSVEEFLKENVTEAETGKATGITIKDDIFIERGNIISNPDNLPIMTNRFKTHIFWMDENPLRKGERVLLKCSTQKSICEVEKFEKIFNSSALEETDTKEEIKNREVADVIIKTNRPLVIENFNKTKELGRFVMERFDICAGGIVTGKE